MSILLLLVDTLNKHWVYNNEVIDNSLTSVNATNYDELSEAEDGIFGATLPELDSKVESFDNTEPVVREKTRPISETTIVKSRPEKTPKIKPEFPDGFSGSKEGLPQPTKQTVKRESVRTTGGAGRWRKE